MPSRHPSLRPAPPAIADDWALFLDVDGSLLEFAEHPDRVAVPERLRATIQALHARLDAAIALVSGRSIDDLDALFDPLRLTAAGLHGLEWRNGPRRTGPPVAPRALAAIRREADAFAAGHPGVVVEDKPSTLALHWRMAPSAAPAVMAFAEAALRHLPGYRLQHGHRVVELRPDDADKGAAIRALIEQPPFAGRTPVFLGDDLTDESGFVVVNRAGGISVLVGDRRDSAARHGLPDPASVREWLQLPGIPTQETPAHDA